MSYEVFCKIVGTENGCILFVGKPHPFIDAFNCAKHGWAASILLFTGTGSQP
jgi:hypothetical protein